MSFSQRIVWLVIAIACIVTIAASGFKIISNGEDIHKKWYNEHIEESFPKRADHHTMNGIVFENEEDWSYFKREGWHLIKADNCEEGELTRCGEYYNGDKDYRSLM